MWEYILHHWWTWPIILNSLCGLYIIRANGVGRSPREHRTSYGTFTTNYPSGWLIPLLLVFGLFLLLFEALFYFLLNLLVVQIENDERRYIREMRKEIEKKYGIKTAIAPAKSPRGYGRRLLVTCPQCGQGYSLFGYGRCTICQYETPFTSEELSILGSTLGNEPTEVLSTA